MPTRELNEKDTMSLIIVHKIYLVEELVKDLVLEGSGMKIHKKLGVLLMGMHT